MTSEPNLTPKQAAEALRIGVEILTVIDRLLHSNIDTATCAIDVVASTGIARMLIVVSSDQNMVAMHEQLCKTTRGDL